MGRVGEEEGRRDIERLILGKYACCWWVGIRAECARRVTFLGRVIWWMMSSGSDVFSYIVFATSGSSIAARTYLWCWLAAVARRLLLYGCA